MKTLLLHLATHYSWLFSERGFRIVDSKWMEGFGGQGIIWMTNGELVIMLVTERNLVHLRFSPGHREGRPDWGVVDCDLVHRYLTGKGIGADLGLEDEEILRGGLHEPTALFVRAHFDQIRDLFANKDPEELEAGFKAIKDKRFEEMWG